MKTVAWCARKKKIHTHITEKARFIQKVSFTHRVLCAFFITNMLMPYIFFFLPSKYTFSLTNCIPLVNLALNGELIFFLFCEIYRPMRDVISLFDACFRLAHTLFSFLCFVQRGYRFWKGIKKINKIKPMTTLAWEKRIEKPQAAAPTILA